MSIHKQQMNDFNSQFNKTQRRVAFLECHQGKFSDDMKRMMAWQSPNSSLRGKLCATYGILDA